MNVGACVSTRSDDRGDHRLSFSTPLHLIPLRQALPLNLELGWWPPSPSEPPASTPHSAGVTLGVGDFTQALVVVPQAPSPPRQYPSPMQLPSKVAQR